MSDNPINSDVIKKEFFELKTLESKARMCSFIVRSTHTLLLLASDKKHKSHYAKGAIRILLIWRFLQLCSMSEKNIVEHG